MSKVKVFVKPDEEFEVTVYACTGPDGAVYCATTLEDLKEIVDNIDERDIEEFHLTFKKLSFGDSIDLYQSIFSITSGNQEGQFNFNPVAIRFRKIKTLLKKWDIKDENGEIVPINEKNIKSLNPIIAGIIGARIDTETGGLLS